MTYCTLMVIAISAWHANEILVPSIWLYIYAAIHIYEYLNPLYISAFLTDRFKASTVL